MDTGRRRPGQRHQRQLAEQGDDVRQGHVAGEGGVREAPAPHHPPVGLHPQRPAQRGDVGNGATGGVQQQRTSGRQTRQGRSLHGRLHSQAEQPHGQGSRQPKQVDDPEFGTDAGPGRPDGAGQQNGQGCHRDSSGQRGRTTRLPIRARGSGTAGWLPVSVWVVTGTVVLGAVPRNGRWRGRCA